MNDIKRKKKVEQNLLFYKFGYIDIDVISEKLIFTSEVNKRILFGNSLIYNCINHSYSDEALMIVNEKRDPKKELFGTPLNHALLEKSPKKTIEILITKSNLNTRDFYTANTALHIALENKYPEEVIKLLITKENVNIGTPLHIALENNYPEEVIKLLITKVNLDKQCNYTYYTPLHKATGRGCDGNIIKLLITNKNKNMEDYKGNTPLYYALRYNYSEEILELLKND